jgi:hypothetical protein
MQRSVLSEYNDADIVRWSPVTCMGNNWRCSLRSIYDETSAGLPSGASQSSTPAKPFNPVQAIKTRQKVYTLESAKRPEKGSVPDVSAISKVR